MHTLRDLQTRVMDALLDEPAGDVADAGIVGATARARLGVYRNTVRDNFVAALRSTYPAICRLVGEAYFRRIALRFQHDHPSRSGDLLHAGGRFPEFLEGLHGDDEFRYLAHVARLEAAVQSALLAAEQAPLDLQALAAVDPAAYDTLRFDLHPTLRLFESPYPALRIWEANVRSDAEPDAMALDSGGDRLAVMRQRLELRFHPLSVGEWRFLDGLGGGETVALAVAGAAAASGVAAGAAPFDATAALRRLVALEAIVHFH